MLERLRDRAKIAFAQFQNGLGPQPTVDESEFPDDVAIISGRASIINRSGRLVPRLGLGFRFTLESVALYPSVWGFHVHLLLAMRVRVQ